MVVARSDGKVIGYVLGFARCASAHTDHSSHVARFPPPPDCYLYGPVCVAEGVRGKGLAAALFKELQTNINGRPAMIFIRADNVPSLRAHQKMEMSELGAFMNEGALYIALGHRGRCPLWS